MGVLDNLSYNTPAWSISVEFFAYIIFALMMIICRPHKLGHFALIGIAIIVNYAVLSTIKPNWISITTSVYLDALAVFIQAS